MPLTSTSSVGYHLLQNLSLIALSLSLLPLISWIALLSHLISPYVPATRRIAHRRKWRAHSSSAARPRRILVTGISMSKGLALARIFYRAGHVVHGADFEPSGIPIPGRYSRSLEKFYRLERPREGSEGDYIQRLIQIIREEGIELWVSVSGEASALEDGEAAELIEKETACRVVQFGLTLTETLHDKHSFIANTRRIGLNVPETHLVTSETEALAVLYPEKLRSSSSRLRELGILAQLNGDEKFVNGNVDRRGSATVTAYIMKAIHSTTTTSSTSSSQDDDSSLTSRANMTLLPLPILHATETHIKSLNPTPFRPFVLQQFIPGLEYCAHTLIISGQVRAFVACPSKEMLLHYTALPTSSALSRAMLRYMESYAATLGSRATGHFSIDFLVPHGVAAAAEATLRVSGAGAGGGGGTEEEAVRGLMGELYAIECNPRVNTAVLLFSDVADDLSEIYLSILEREHGSKKLRLMNAHEMKRHSFTHLVPSTNANPTTSPHTTNISSPTVLTPSSSSSSLSSSIKPSQPPSYYWLSHDLPTLLVLPLYNWLRQRESMMSLLGQWITFLEHVLYWRDGVWEVWDPWVWWWSCAVYWPGRLFVEGVWRGKRWGRVNVANGKWFGV